MKKKIGNFKRSLFTIGLSASMVLSAIGVCYAASYTYANDYVMDYTLTKSSSTATATTEARYPDYDAIAFASIFAYKNGTVLNSASLQDYTNVELDLKSSSATSFKSIHALKDMNYDPMGTTKSLEI